MQKDDLGSVWGGEVWGIHLYNFKRFSWSCWYSHTSHLLIILWNKSGVLLMKHLLIFAYRSARKMCAKWSLTLNHLQDRRWMLAFVLMCILNMKNLYVFVGCHTPPECSVVSEEPLRLCLQFSWVWLHDNQAQLWICQFLQASCGTDDVGWIPVKLQKQCVAYEKESGGMRIIEVVWPAVSLSHLVFGLVGMWAICTLFATGVSRLFRRRNLILTTLLSFIWNTTWKIKWFKLQSFFLKYLLLHPKYWNVIKHSENYIQQVKC